MSKIFVDHVFRTWNHILFHIYFDVYPGYMVKFRRKAAFCSVNPPSQTKSHLQPLRMPGREVGFHLPRGCLGQLLPRSGQKWGKFQENHQIIINMFSVEWVAVCCRSWKSSRAIIVACLSPHFLPKIWIHPYLFFSISHANFDGLCFFFTSPYLLGFSCGNRHGNSPRPGGAKLEPRAIKGFTGTQILGQVLKWCQHEGQLINKKYLYNINMMFHIYQPMRISNPEKTNQHLDLCPGLMSVFANRNLVGSWSGSMCLIWKNHAISLLSKHDKTWQVVLSIYLKHTVDGCEILHHLGWSKPYK